ncbi:LTA synthase family protein [Candidatus Endomicrobiellum agilis]|uniref:LTA synthase family protein n=1 Tax=Candidatus Endomicrobiellum agilis TaxID=3238957 RepID=UPI0035A8D712
MFIPLMNLILVTQKSAKFFKICTLLMSFSVTAMILVLSGDFFYFPEVNRHMTEEIITALGDKKFIIKYSLQYYWWVLFLVFSIVVLGTVKIFRYIDRKFNPQPVSLLKSIIVFLSVICFVAVGIRGGLSRGRPVNLDNAYGLIKNLKSVQLILNGAFTQIHTLKYKTDASINKYPQGEAIENVQKLLLSDREFMPDKKNYPLMRQIKNPVKVKNYNIFIVLLESWTPRYIDSFGDENYGVTPNFDEIVKNGVVFTNAYAAGTRSLFGISASFLGIPLMPGAVDRLNRFGLMSNISLMSEVFNERGYCTMFMQSAMRNSFRLCAFSKNVLRFQESYGKEDMPRLMDYMYNLDCGYDYDLFDFAAKKAGNNWRQGRPFFIFSFTGTTHAGFVPTVKKFDKYPSNNSRNKYLNTLYYSDYSIGHLMDIAKKEGWFDNTIFIFIADHVVGYFRRNDSVGERFRIPFVIYAPKILKPQKIDYIVSQADLLPTIYHLMGVQKPFSALGTNALDKQARHFALINDGTDIIFVEKNNYVKHNRSMLTGASLDENGSEFKRLRETLLSLDKALTSLLQSNKWYKN